MPPVRRSARLQLRDAHSQTPCAEAATEPRKRSGRSRRMSEYRLQREVEESSETTPKSSVAIDSPSSKKREARDSRSQTSLPKPNLAAASHAMQQSPVTRGVRSKNTTVLYEFEKRKPTRLSTDRQSNVSQSWKDTGFRMHRDSIAMLDRFVRNREPSTSTSESCCSDAGLVADLLSSITTQESIRSHGNGEPKVNSGRPPQASRKRKADAEEGRMRAAKKSKIEIRAPRPMTPIEYKIFETMLDSNKLPCPLRLSQIAIRYQVLRKSIQKFCQDTFSFTQDLQSCQDWPLHKLRTHHPQLYLIVQYLASDSVEGWRHFLTSARTRPHLITAIVSEWLGERIFNHTAFGLCDNSLRRLENIDKEYILYDAVVRTKKRAEVLSDIIPPSGDARKKATSCIKDACALLTQELMILLQPFFDARNAQKYSDDHAEQLVSLENIVTAAANLHLSIRLSGRSGLVIRHYPAARKGSQFVPSGPNLCVNAEDCETVPVRTAKTGRQELRVMMTCWPRIEAYQPAGPDIELLEQIQTSAERFNSYRTREGLPEKEFSWADHENLWEELPRELHGRPEYMSDSDSGSQTDDESDSNPRIRARQKQEKKKRGPYMIMYPNLAPALVYCEWRPISGSEKDSTQRQSLKEAVSEARSQHENHITLKIEDQIINFWNDHAAYIPACQWALVLAGSAYLVRNTSVIQHLSYLKQTNFQILHHAIDSIRPIKYLDTKIKQLLLECMSVATTTSGSSSPSSPFNALNSETPTTHLIRALKTLIQSKIKPFQLISLSLSEALKELHQATGNSMGSDETSSTLKDHVMQTMTTTIPVRRTVSNTVLLEPLATGEDLEMNYDS